LKCGDGEGRRRSVGKVEWKIKKYGMELGRKGISTYIKT
jgi:hypothetical protein